MTCFELSLCNRMSTVSNLEEKAYEFVMTAAVYHPKTNGKQHLPNVLF
jgi:hypothetical protein